MSENTTISVHELAQRDAQAAVGFAKYQQYLMSHEMSVDGQTVLIFVLIGVVGSLIGKSLNARMNQQVLKKVFAVFLVLLGGFVIVNEGSKVVSPLASVPSAQAQNTEVHEQAGGMPLATQPSRN